MKDVCGNKLAVGDKVVVTDSLGLVGTYFVHSFNNDKVRISKAAGKDWFAMVFLHQVTKIQS